MMETLTEIFTLSTTTMVIRQRSPGSSGHPGRRAAWHFGLDHVALLLPFTYTMEPMTAIVLLASVYIGAEYGGSIPAILIRHARHQLRRRDRDRRLRDEAAGRAGEALGISLWSGFLGSMFGLVMLVTMTEPCRGWRSPSSRRAIFGLGVLGLSVIASMSAAPGEGAGGGRVGLMIATVGADPIAGVNRFTFGIPDLLNGIEPVLVMVGVFALSELMVQSGAPDLGELKEKVRVRCDACP